jgi:cyclic pyranopterin phosphate synthase
MHKINDTYGRSFKTLRVSLLNSCNLGCVYCVEGDDVFLKKSNLSTTHQSEAQDLLPIIKKLHDVLHLETIRLTGGEPLLYRDIIQLIEGIKSFGINNIKLTTNGFLLERTAKQLKDAGMRSVNISLDAVDEDVFFLMSKRSNVQRIINGIDAALAAGLEVKINSVIMKGINNTQILPLLKFAFERNISIRFLEVMAMGHLYQHADKYLFTQQEILNTIAAKYKFKPIERSASSTAHYWQTTEQNIFGIIANESEPFCHDCNRLRLDSAGNIYGCLSSNNPISLKDISDESVLHEKLMQALLQKQPVKFTGSSLSMLHIGG